MIELIELGDWHTLIFAFVLGSIRISMFLSIAPFMGTSVMTGTVRMAVTFALFAIVAPTVTEGIPAIFPLTVGSMFLALGLILKEAFLGFILAFLASAIFWALLSAGFFIDNQRGASMAQGSDPLTGDEASPTASFFLQSAIYVFIASGSFAACLSLFLGTYLFWPVNELLPAAFFKNPDAALFFAGIVAKLAVNMVLLAAPVVIACLFTDMALGLINRFASQLNVYILAMPIKSALASFLLITYFALLMTDAPQRFALFASDLNALRGFLP